MALTHAQRTSIFNTLAEVMGQDDAEILMQHLPPSGWDNVATKEDLRAGFAEIHAAMSAGFAQAATERAEIKVQTATELAEIKVQTATEFAEIKAQTATDLAEIIRRQAWHLYIVVSTIVLATVSIWIALLTQPAGS
ncbi:MAG: hypothetical protein F4Y12_03260 [Acidimicrobiaceae bacterium]|nr:hypothetical protein [Acidimicrobiaceae bacterium]